MININNLERDLRIIREKSPLIHNITNYVVMNSTANALLSIGASPVMAHAIDEIEEMVKLSSALVINIGTIDSNWLKSMQHAANIAREHNIPIVLDPVGAGATTFRTKSCKQIIAVSKPSIIRGNASEIMSLLDARIQTKGVDSSSSSNEALAYAQELASNHECVVSISGEIDYITDGLNIEIVKNGNPMMAKVTGMGCTASAITGAFIAINPNKLEAASHSMLLMGICGEIAANKSRGNGSLQINFLDELYNVNVTTIQQYLK